jgi:hypothetical protein
MSIHVHKTGLNKTLGQQSDGIVTTDLTGNFIPTAGIETLYWDNQVSSGLNLRRFNGVTHSTTDPDHFLLDGTDDYLGAASTSYGGDPIQIGGGTRPFTLGQWFKYNNVNHYIFFCGTAADVGSGMTPQYHSYILLEVLTSNDQCKLTVRDPFDSFNFISNSDSATFSSFTFVDDTWYYVALTHDGGSLYTVYVNGSYIGSLTSTYALTEDGSMVNAIECGAANVDGTISYSGAGTKIGHIHVYDEDAGGSQPGGVSCLTNSQVRQNFLASHDIHNNRIYGATYTG